uniref:Reverse transcriptase domain-containing protein n=1 Tax=Tanacetum cinerariifolium TaxID=118510 RepID=A0A6L2JDS9_TANCI|nr:hypothetical protein [Tanacetum cinerariifolium]
MIHESVENVSLIWPIFEENRVTRPRKYSKLSPTDAIQVDCDPPQETSIEIFNDQENAINSVQTFLRKFNRISFFETPKVLFLAWDRVFKIKDALGNKKYKSEDIQELLHELFNDVQNIHEELAEYINTPGWNRPAFCNNDDDDHKDCTIAVTPDFPITDSLIKENEHLDTIPVMESDEYIKSSVENLVPILSESENFLEDEWECDVPDCDDSQTTNFSTFSNPLFDDSISSDDDEFNPIHNEDLDSTLKNVHFDTKSYLLESLLNRDESIPSGIDCDNSDSKGDDLFLERLLHDDPIPLSDTLDFSIDVRVFLPFFTYPVTSSILLSSASEDIFFDPDIYHFSSLEPGVFHRSGTFMKFNESPMEILSSTCSLMDQ